MAEELAAETRAFVDHEVTPGETYAYRVQTWHGFLEGARSTPPRPPRFGSDTFIERVAEDAMAPRVRVGGYVRIAESRKPDAM